MAELQPGYFIPKRLLALIDDYKDAHGNPGDASVSRMLDVKPQTISSWRNRGLKRPPAVDTMKRLAEVVGLDYEAVVLRAVLLDIEWLDDDSDTGESRITS